MNNIIQKYKFDGIWHFTDRKNLASIIEQKGLLSLAEIERRGLEIPVPGGNEWSHDADKEKNVHKYVHLAFVNDHPMLFIAKQDGRITDPIWLKIDSSIILEGGVQFSADVSNKAGIPIIGPEQARDQIDFEVIFTRTDWRDPEIKARRRIALKAEILVPGMVPIQKILGYKNG